MLFKRPHYLTVISLVFIESVHSSSSGTTALKVKLGEMFYTQAAPPLATQSSVERRHANTDMISVHGRRLRGLDGRRQGQWIMAPVLSRRYFRSFLPRT